jgi:hypothetical protein
MADRPHECSVERTIGDCRSLMGLSIVTERLFGLLRGHCLSRAGYWIGRDPD